MRKFAGIVLTSGLLCSALLGAEAPKASQPMILPANPVKPEAAKQLTVEELLVFLPETVATVNGKNITKKDIVDSMKAMYPDGKVPAMVTPEVAKAGMGDFVRDFVREQLVKSMAEKAGYSTEAAVKKFLNDEIKKRRPEELEMMRQTLKMQNKTLEGYFDELAKDPKTREMVAAQRYLQQAVFDQAKVADKEVADYYAKNKAMFKNEWVKVSHILIAFPEEAVQAKKVTKEMKDKAKKEIDAILADLRKNAAKFETLAETKSGCPSGKQAKGSLGVVTKGRMVPEFEEAAFALNKDGEISGVVETVYGYHVIRRDGAGEYLPLEGSLKKYIEESIRREKISEELKKLFEKLEKDSKIQYFVQNQAMPAAK